MRFAYNLLLVGVVASTVLPAQAQQCSDVLQYGIWESYDRSDAAMETQQVANWLCSASSRNANGSFSYGKAKLTGGSAGTSNLCSSNNSSFVLTIEGREAIRKASSDVVSEWRRCMTDAVGTFASIIHRADPRFFTVMLVHRAPPPNPNDPPRRYVLPIATLKPTGAFECSQPLADLQTKGVSVSSGTPITCTRSNIHESVAVDVHFNNNAAGQPLFLAAVPRRLTIDEIKDALVGQYRVVLGPKGGCGGGAPNTTPKKDAIVYKDEKGNLIAVNECGSEIPNNVSMVNVVSETALHLYRQNAVLRMNGSEISWVDDHGDRKSVV